MSNYQSILVDPDERFGIVTLNRPNELNTLNFQLVSELANALEQLDHDEEIRCMVITCAGEKAFAAGADIKEMSDKSPAVKLAREVTARGPIAVRLAKQAVLASFEITLEEGLEMERKNFYLSKAM